VSAVLQCDNGAVGDNRLAELAVEIKDAAARWRKSAQDAAEAAIAAGHSLIEAKALVGHGQWLPWLHANCDMSGRSASRYMQIARSGLKSATVADLGISGVAQTIFYHAHPLKGSGTVDLRKGFEPPNLREVISIRRSLIGDPDDHSDALVWRAEGTEDFYNVLAFDQQGMLAWACGRGQPIWLKHPVPWNLIPQFLARTGFNVSEPDDLLATKFRGREEVDELFRLVVAHDPERPAGAQP
jgi:hypothetical protein